MAKRFNIRMAGVGGQGVVTGSHILSTAVIRAGGESTIVPFYGSEKRMAPVESYVRVSDEPIYEIGEITVPHICIIFHPQGITHGQSYTIPLYFGLKQNGVLLINHDGPMKLPPQETNELKERNAKRSEEHTSELQSPCNLVCRLLLEKKKKQETELLRLT